jgi:hypothetical protein
MHDDFLDRTPLRVLLDIPPAIIDAAHAMAYACYRGERHDQVENLCRGLLALDHRYWWTYALYAATLRDSGRPALAREVVQNGLRYQPDQPILLALSAELACLPTAPAPHPGPVSTDVPEAA